MGGFPGVDLAIIFELYLKAIIEKQNTDREKQENQPNKIYELFGHNIFGTD